MFCREVPELHGSNLVFLGLSGEILRTCKGNTTSDPLPLASSEKMGVSETWCHFSAKQKFWKALKWHQVSETPIFSEDARGRGSEVVFPLHVRKISPLRPRKTKLDPCSSGTSVRNTAYFTFTQQIYHAPKMEAFRRCQTSNAKQKFWKALKWHQVSETPIFSEDARGRGSEVVFPLHVRKISPLRPRKTKLDPCSSGTSLQNIQSFTLTQPIYNAPKMEAFQRCQTL